MAAPRNRAGLVLELKAQGAAHVALSAVREPSDDMYRVVIERSRVWIAKGKHGKSLKISCLFPDHSEIIFLNNDSKIISR